MIENLEKIFTTKEFKIIEDQEDQEDKKTNKSPYLLAFNFFIFI